MAAEHGAAARHPARLPRRRTDVAEDVAAWILLSLGLILFLAATAVGIGVHGQEAERARTEAASRTPVVAVLLEAAPRPVASASGSGPGPLPVTARWTDPGGQQRTGPVPAPIGAWAGHEVTVWIDHDGTIVAPPATAGGAVFAGVAAAAGILMAGGTLLGTAWLLVRWATGLLNARRWAAGWAQVAPIWSRDRR